MRAYISHAECGHTIPSLATLEKWAKALDLKMYQVFYGGKHKPIAPEVAMAAPLDARERKLIELYRRLPEKDRVLFLTVIRDAANRECKRAKAKE